MYVKHGRQSVQCFKFKLFLFYNDYETSYTTYIKHARGHRCLRSGGLRVGGNRSSRRKSTCLTWWPHGHITCWCRVLNPGRSGERRARYHCGSQTANTSPDRFNVCIDILLFFDKEAHLFDLLLVRFIYSFRHRYPTLPSNLSLARN